MTVNVEIDSRILKCQKILEMDPNSQIFAALAEAYRKKGELEKAFQVCHSGLRIHPNYGAAHLVMAKVNLDRGLYDWAATEVEKAREAGGDLRTIELLLAEINIYKGEFQAAIKSLKRLSTSDPGNMHVKRLLEIATRIPEEQQEQTGEPAETKSPDPAVIPQAESPNRIIPADLLAEALRIRGVEGALFINAEGLVIESRWEAGVDQTTCGAVMAEVNTFVEQELMKISFGRVTTVLIETSTLVFYIMIVPGGMFLIAGGSGINLGSLRMKMATLLDRVQTS